MACDRPAADATQTAHASDAQSTALSLDAGSLASDAMISGSDDAATSLAQSNDPVPLDAGGTGDGFRGGRAAAVYGGPPVRATTVRQGAIKASDGLPPEVIMRIVAQNMGRFRLCYEASLPPPRPSGRVTITFDINPKGNVTVKSQDSDLPEPKVVACVAHVFPNLTFPSPSDGKSVTVTFPLLFSSDD
jgi:hypothetical protein